MASELDFTYTSAYKPGEPLNEGSSFVSVTFSYWIGLENQTGRSLALLALLIQC